MKSSARCRSSMAIPAWFIITAASVMVGCRGIEADKLYALRLPGPPGERDWRAAVPYRLAAKDGAVHLTDAEAGAQEVDRDVVHRTTASCHHGPSLKSTVPVWLRAYHDGENLYIRASWPDDTEDKEPRQWIVRQGSWRLEGNGGDGISLVFPIAGLNPFQCAALCHLDDWTVSQGIFRESARMRVLKKGELSDLWLWRSAEKDALDLFIDDIGMKTDGSQLPARGKNSRLDGGSANSGRGSILDFAPEDSPRFDFDAKPINSSVLPAEGRRAPAYMPLPVEAGEDTITAVGSYRNGVWEVTFKRPFRGPSSGDAAFAVGGEYLFGLSILDNTVRDHHVVAEAGRLAILR